MLWIGHSGCFGFLVLVGGPVQVVVTLLGCSSCVLGVAVLNCLAAEVVRPGTTGLLMGVKYSRVGSIAWVLPISTVTTRTVVELA